MVQEFKHMLPRDAKLWQRFLFHHQDYFERFDYDVRVGDGVDIGPGFPDFAVTQAKLLTQKRIDAVGYHGTEIWVIEAKPDAGLSALGQLLGYRVLWNNQYPQQPVTYLAIVTDFLGPDEITFYEHYGIKTYELPPE